MEFMQRNDYPRNVNESSSNELMDYYRQFIVNNHQSTHQFTNNINNNKYYNENYNFPSQNYQNENYNFPSQNNPDENYNFPSHNNHKGNLIRNEIINQDLILPKNASSMDYEINYDPDPEIIRKENNENIVYKQEVAVRYLQPPTPPPPGPIIIKEVRPPIPPAAPPIIIRQRPPRASTPPPLVVRENPPNLPAAPGPKVITKQLPAPLPPPRRVIIERLPPLPPKPRSLIVERWLPYKQQKRRVIYQRANPTKKPETVKNLIIQWSGATVKTVKEIHNLGVIRVNPQLYVEKYDGNLCNAQLIERTLEKVGLSKDQMRSMNLTTKIGKPSNDYEQIDNFDEGFNSSSHQFQYVSHSNLSDMYNGIQLDDERIQNDLETNYSTPNDQSNQLNNDLKEIIEKYSIPGFHTFDIREQN
ncbi:hypothetical protein SNEBB_008585 [Seison nebaliae]|nr:hypothetical protein SNEBB_008585 [Seison nebaliae]